MHVLQPRLQAASKYTDKGGSNQAPVADSAASKLPRPLRKLLQRLGYSHELAELAAAQSFKPDNPYDQLMCHLVVYSLYDRL